MAKKQSGGSARAMAHSQVSVDWVTWTRDRLAGHVFHCPSSILACDARISRPYHKKGFLSMATGSAFPCPDRLALREAPRADTRVRHGKATNKPHGGRWTRLPPILRTR